jgi:hypothetical protein
MVAGPLVALVWIGPGAAPGAVAKVCPPGTWVLTPNVRPRRLRTRLGRVSGYVRTGACVSFVRKIRQAVEELLRAGRGIAGWLGAGRP